MENPTLGRRSAGCTKKGQWPVKSDSSENLRELNRTAWAVRDASRSCDIIHINNCFGLPYSRFIFTRHGDRAFCNVVDVQGERLFVKVAFRK